MLDDADAVTFDPRDLSSTSRIPLGTLPGSLDCYTTARCTAVGLAGQAVIFAPPAKASSRSTAIRGADAFEAVSCPAADSCAAVDLVGQLSTGSSSG